MSAVGAVSAIAAVFGMLGLLGIALTRLRSAGIIQNVADESLAGARKIAYTRIERALGGIILTDYANYRIGIAGDDLNVRKNRAGRGVDDNEIRHLAKLLDELRKSLCAQHLGRVIVLGGAADREEVGVHLTDDLVRLSLALEIINEVFFAGSVEFLYRGGLSYIGIEEYHLLADARKRERRVESNGGFTLAGNRARKEDDLVAVFDRRFLHALSYERNGIHKVLRGVLVVYRNEVVVRSSVERRVVWKGSYAAQVQHASDLIHTAHGALEEGNEYRKDQACNQSDSSSRCDQALVVDGVVCIGRNRGLAQKHHSSAADNEACRMRILIDRGFNNLQRVFRFR